MTNVCAAGPSLCSCRSKELLGRSWQQWKIVVPLWYIPCSQTTQHDRWWEPDGQVPISRWLSTKSHQGKMLHVQLCECCLYNRINYVIALIYLCLSIVSPLGHHLGHCYTIQVVHLCRHNTRIGTSRKGMGGNTYANARTPNLLAIRNARENWTGKESNYTHRDCNWDVLNVLSHTLWLFLAQNHRSPIKSHSRPQSVASASIIISHPKCSKYKTTCIIRNSNGWCSWSRACCGLWDNFWGMLLQ